MQDKEIEKKYRTKRCSFNRSSTHSVEANCFRCVRNVTLKRERKFSELLDNNRKLFAKSAHV